MMYKKTYSTVQYKLPDTNDVRRALPGNIRNKTCDAREMRNLTFVYPLWLFATVCLSGLYECR